jgi:hypothetical protein
MIRHNKKRDPTLPVLFENMIFYLSGARGAGGDG